jgi:para-nitrobenzyl esterase
VIASVLGVSASRATAIAAKYPLGAYPAPVLALSTVVSDANFACPALQVDRWTARRAPTFGYQFNDDSAPPLFAGPGFPPIATHASEIQYLFDQPNAPFAAPLNPTQEKLAVAMRAAWANFAARGNPSTRAVHWPRIGNRARMLSRGPRSSVGTPPSTTVHSGVSDDALTEMCPWRRSSCQGHIRSGAPGPARPAEARFRAPGAT